MSKSYGKYKMCGIACGHNTPWYRLRRKHWRRVNRNRLRNIISKYDNEEIDENFNPFKIPKEDQWREPTDGHWKLTPKRLQKRINKILNPGWFGIYLTKDKNHIKK